MTEKMNKVAKSIENIIRMVFPADYLSVVFEYGIFDMSDIVNQIMVVCCKNAYDVVTEKHPLLYYVKKENELPDTEESERKALERILKKINQNRGLLYNLLLEYGFEIEELKNPDMSTLSSRMEGYKLTPFQYWEITDTYDNELVNSIFEQNIFVKNHFKNSKFREVENRYNQVLVNSLNNIENGVDVVESFLKVFVLEYKYCFDFYYSISQCMIQRKIEPDEIYKIRLLMFSGTSNVCSCAQSIGSLVLSHEYPSCPNNLLSIRSQYIQAITESQDDEFQRISCIYNEARYIVSEMIAWMTYQETPIKDWFVQNTDSDDWKSVFVQYGIQNVVNTQKDLNNSKTIRYIKGIYKLVENPDFRPTKK